MSGLCGFRMRERRGAKGQSFDLATHLGGSCMNFIQSGKALQPCRFSVKFLSSGLVLSPEERGYPPSPPLPRINRDAPIASDESPIDSHNIDGAAQSIKFLLEK